MAAATRAKKISRKGAKPQRKASVTEISEMPETRSLSNA
jgi:hypothetical protein